MVKQDPCCVCKLLSQIMRRAPSSVCEEVVVGAGALQPIINLLGLSTIPLPYKAHAAGKSWFHMAQDVCGYLASYDICKELRTSHIKHAHAWDG